MTAPSGLSSGLVCCQIADDAGGLAAHHRIRHEVFVHEQGIFDETDVDVLDTRPDVLHVLGLCNGVPAGAVRLYPLDPATGLWQGDRLAVLPGYRTTGLGAPLVRFAVFTAGSRGGNRMIAHVQLANQRFFERLGWVGAGDVEQYVHRPHRLMEIELAGPADR